MSRIPRVVAVALLLVSTNAFAQQDENIAEYVPEGDIKPMENEKRQGWDGTLQTSASVNLVSNDNVVGQTDGISTLVGVGFLGGLDYVFHKHEIRNTLQVTEAFARTPVLPQFVKSDDIASLESLYSYFLVGWFGPFARLNAETAIFESQQLTAQPVDYVITDQEGGVTTRTTERLPLAKQFQPFTLNESVGVFAEPVQTAPFNVSTRLGFGLRETWAQNVYVINDDPATEAVVEVRDITNRDSGLTIFQGGLEAFVGVDGTFRDKRISYDLGGTVLIPFINNDPRERSATELTRIGLAGNIGFAMFDWLSLSYKLRVIRDPQLVDGAQVQNNLLVTFKYAFVERSEPEPPPGPSEAEKDADEAKKRADDAEKRAIAAEARAAELEKKLAEQPPPAPQPEPQP